MSSVEYQQLVENLRHDGALTSTPTVAKAGTAPLTAAKPNDLEVLSGNHRVEAAIEAGIEEADVLEIVSPLTREHKLAVQLSHNRIVGKDDPSVLFDLYKGLAFDWKQYSGLTDDDFQLDELDVSALAIGAPRYEELQFLFLPEDREVFQQVMTDIEKKLKDAKRKVPPPRYMVRLEDFCLIFDALVATKKHTNIQNGALALRAMAMLAVERIAQLEADLAAKAQP